MPLGSKHSLTGVLYQARRGLDLHVPDGGVWHLEVDRTAWRMIGRRVKVQGARSGFDRLDVRKIEPC
jgi:hypothetical protein